MKINCGRNVARHDDIVCFYDSSAVLMIYNYCWRRAVHTALRTNILTFHALLWLRSQSTSWLACARLHCKRCFTFGVRYVRWPTASVCTFWILTWWLNKQSNGMAKIIFILIATQNIEMENRDFVMKNKQINTDANCEFKRFGLNFNAVLVLQQLPV